MDQRVVLAISIVLGTAVLMAAYDHTTHEDPSGKIARKTFAKVVVVGGIVSAAILYFTKGQSKPRVMTEPFPSTDPVPTPQIGGPSPTVPLPTQ